jgi:class 3 adenylate cyclase
LRRLFRVRPPWDAGSPGRHEGLGIAGGRAAARRSSNLRGYTAFNETAEPEEVLKFLREYHGALGPLVSQFEGTLDQFSGDGIMVFFNDVRHWRQRSAADQSRNDASQ